MVDLASSSAAMEILNPILNVTLLPTTVLLLIFIAPALAAFRAAAWIFSLLFPSSIDGKVVIITGASSGIGRVNESVRAASK